MAWKFDPAFAGGTTHPVLPRPPDWQESVGQDSTVEGGSPQSLAPWMAEIVLEDGDGDGMLSGTASHPGAADSFTFDGTVYDISSVYNGDAAVIDGQRYELVTFYGEAPAGGYMQFSLPMQGGKIVPAFAGDVSATEWIYDPNDVQLPVSGVVCFVRGTLIETPGGPVAVEDLAVGDPVRTRDRGMQPIRWIGAVRLTPAQLRRRPELCPVRIAAGALGPGMPARDLRLSPQHRVLLRSAIAERMFGRREVLAAACKLVGMPGVGVEPPGQGIEYFHFLCDRHEIVFSEGAETESLFPGPEAMRSLDPAAREEILTLFPDIPQRLRALARPQIRGRRLAGLTARHRRNAKELVAAG